MDRIVQLLKALGDETRLKILIILSRRRICAKGIAKHLGISEAAVSQHIKILKDAGIIVGEKVGYFVQYDLQESSLVETIQFIEQIKNGHIQGSCPLDTHIPKECAESCSVTKNKCCKKIRVLEKKGE